jgi:hypothetical protein
MHCVLEEYMIDEVVPEVHFVALLKLQAPVRTHGALVQEWSTSIHPAHTLPTAKPSMIH